MKRSISTGIMLLVLILSGAIARSEDRIIYYHHDALGSPTAATDEDGATLWTERYKPHGGRIIQAPESADHSLWFTGHSEDAESGLLYMGVRYYDPEIGRFLSIDSVSVQPGVPHSFNRYSYANNNPYLFVDPDGRQSMLYSDVRQSSYGNCWFLSTVAAGVHTGDISTGYLAAKGYDAGQTYSPVANGENYVNFLAEKHDTNRKSGANVTTAFTALWGDKPNEVEFTKNNLVNVVRMAKRANEKPTVVDVRRKSSNAWTGGASAHAMAVVGFEDSTFPGTITIYNQANKRTWTVDLGQQSQYNLLDRMVQKQ